MAITLLLEGGCTSIIIKFNVWDTRASALASILNFGPSFSDGGKLLFSPDGHFVLG